MRPIFSGFCLVSLVGLCASFAMPQLPGLSHSSRQLTSVERTLRLRSLLGVSPSYDAGKCGTWYGVEAARQFSASTPERRAAIEELLAAPVREKNRVIGHFRIYYDTATFNTPALVQIGNNDACQQIPGTTEAYIDSVGAFFNYAWEIEIDSLGYTPPPLGDDSLYPIYVSSLGAYNYGQTVPAARPWNAGTPPLYKTYIEVDNTFCNVFSPSRGMPGLKVTAAHEFHHSIQLGSYAEWPDDHYFYEITSTWMEDVVYTDVNDYYQYLEFGESAGIPPAPRGQFAYPDYSFTATTNLLQYSRSIWGKYIEKRFSRNLMKRTWEHMRQVPSLPAIDAALNDAGSSFRQAFLEWSLWNYYTWDRSDTVNYYSEGNHYPPIVMQAPIEYNHEPRSFGDSIQATASIYQPICLLDSSSPNCGLSGKVIAIVSNLDAASSRGGSWLNFTYDIADQGDGSYKQLSNGLFVRLNVGEPQNWSSQEVATKPLARVLSDVLVFPNPFNPQGSKPVSFSFPLPLEKEATLIILSSSMMKVADKTLPVVVTPAGQGVEWDGHDDYGNVVGSGIYIYHLSTAGREYMGKFSVIKP